MNRFYAFVALTIVGSSWGPVRIAATSRGLAAVELLSTGDGFAAGLARRGLIPSTAESGHTAARLATAAATAVEAFLAGEPVALETLPVDMDDRPEWDRLVLGAVAAIPRGAVASYGEVARRVGRTGAARAVGGAVGRNPVGLLIPCHRVIAADGSLGGYGAAAWGGREAALEVKRALLALEGVRIGC